MVAVDSPEVWCQQAHELYNYKSVIEPKPGYKVIKQDIKPEPEKKLLKATKSDGQEFKEQGEVVQR